jgi:hypothetical protein
MQLTADRSNGEILEQLIELLVVGRIQLNASDSHGKFFNLSAASVAGAAVLPPHHLHGAAHSSPWSWLLQELTLQRSYPSTCHMVPRLQLPADTRGRAFAEKTVSFLPKSDARATWAHNAIGSIGPSTPSTRCSSSSSSSSSMLSTTYSTSRRLLSRGSNLYRSYSAMPITARRMLMMSSSAIRHAHHGLRDGIARAEAVRTEFGLVRRYDASGAADGRERCGAGSLFARQRRWWRWLEKRSWRLDYCVLPLLIRLHGPCKIIGHGPSFKTRCMPVRCYGVNMY